MDADILTAIWFECKDLSDIERTLLQALAFHCTHRTPTPAGPSVGRLFHNDPPNRNGIPAASCRNP